MARLPKIPVNGTVVSVCTSVEEGFIFPANPLVEQILLKSMAQAQALHPLKICHFLFESTHAHFLVVIENPDDLKGFMERFKCETSHAINRLLGRKKRTIWCEGYDSPMIANSDQAIDEICYLYENPCKDGLVDAIDHYPGLSSWLHYKRNNTVFKTAWIPRDAFRKLPNGVLSENDYRVELKLVMSGRKKNQLEIDPDAWMRVFGVHDENEKRELNNRMEKQLRENEALHREARKEQDMQPLGSARLRLTPIGAPYIPDRTGRRMFCLGSTREDRAPFISLLKSKLEEKAKVREEWERGIFTGWYPSGLYPPPLPKKANLLGAFSDR